MSFELLANEQQVIISKSQRKVNKNQTLLSVKEGL